MTVVADIPVALRFTIEPGENVAAGIAAGFARAACKGGVVSFATGRCDPFSFVMPAASPDGAHVAWYSSVFPPKGEVALRECVASVGERDGAPFIHCHGRWQTADGMRMGHMLAPDCIVTAPVLVTGLGFANATFHAAPDAETQFTLFEPVATNGATTGPSSALLVRIRPNIDVCAALEEVCRRNGFDNARVVGVGSLNEVRFVDGRQVNSHATELFVREGRVSRNADGWRARLDIAVVDMAGHMAEGEIARGDNPVCITFELVISHDHST